MARRPRTDPSVEQGTKAVAGGIIGSAAGSYIGGGIGAVALGLAAGFGCDAAIEHFGQFYEIVGELPDIVRYGTDVAAGLAGAGVGAGIGGTAGALAGLGLGGVAGYFAKDKSSKNNR